MAPKPVLRVTLVQQVRYDGERRLQQVYQRLWHKVISEVENQKPEKEQQDETDGVIRPRIDQTARTRSYD